MLQIFVTKDKNIKIFARYIKKSFDFYSMVILGSNLRIKSYRNIYSLLIFTLWRSFWILDIGSNSMGATTWTWIYYLSSTLMMNLDQKLICYGKISFSLLLDWQYSSIGITKCVVKTLTHGAHFNGAFIWWFFGPIQR